MPDVEVRGHRGLWPRCSRADGKCEARFDLTFCTTKSLRARQPGKALAAPQCGARNPPKANEANYLNFRFGAEFPLYGRTGNAKCRSSDRGGRASDQDGRGLPDRGCRLRGCMRRPAPTLLSLSSNYIMKSVLSSRMLTCRVRWMGLSLPTMFAGVGRRRKSSSLRGT